jgi:hypothetical protein
MIRRRLVALGDPQAPFERVLDVLRAHGALTAHDRVAPDVHLVVMGDYFDYGGREDRDEATAAAARTFGFFVSHEEEHVTLLAGNHDLARIGELLRLDDAAFARAQAEADLGYFEKTPSRPEVDFRRDYDLPGWEIVARDFSAFHERQRKSVLDALSARRLRAAYAPAPDTLLLHAGLTLDTLAALGIEHERDARVIAQRLNRALFEAFDLWRSNPQAPFFVPGLHAPGNQHGEGTGIFYHRPAIRAPNGGRRFAPARLPPGLTQVIGHIGDKKCRELLGLDPANARPGPLRHMIARGDEVRYEPGLPAETARDAATMIFVDGTMREAAPADYELFTLRPA